jgi:7-cyano-7-deazaguanine synthase
MERGGGAVIPKTIMHLLSGGLDSVTMLYDLKNQGHLIHCLLFDYKQRHRQELKMAMHHAEKCRVQFSVIELPQLGGLTEESWVVPNRNAIFLSVAVNVAVRAQAETVTIGCNLDDAENFPDCRNSFIEAINEAFKSAGYAVEVCAPYLGKRKWEIGAIAREMGIRADSVWTCYLGGKLPCGKCPACEKLKIAMP